MSRQITIQDLLVKLKTCLNENQKRTTKTELMRVFMLDNTHPWINSQGTYNEKMRLLERLGFLTKLNAEVYTIEWNCINEQLKEWAVAE